MMTHKFISFLGASILALQLRASGPEPRPINPNEGMWLPHLVKSLNINEMQQMGFKLTADDIYNINKSSIKDAVVQLGGFCSAEMVSPEGLLFTNHHCGYDAIQTHSSVDHDYLTDGFWAMKKSDELSNPGLSVSFLVRIEDVTQKVMGAAAGASAEDRDGKMQEAIEKIEEETIGENEAALGMRCEVQSMFYGNQFHLFVYQTYRDVRLVGAPPSAIGKYGGDTDNWMWPRHTGDFSIFRVYADKDNNPADYSADNVPYKPKHFFPVSIKGLKEGDFTMTMGYPGSTERYLPSSAIEQAYKNDNPTIVKILGKRLEIMKEGMDADPKVRIQLASSYASLANTHKYYIGQNRGLDRRGLIEEKQAFEKDWMKWVNADPARKEKYSGVLDMMAKNYADHQATLKLSSYMNMAGFGPAMVGFGVSAWRLKSAMEKKPDDKEAWQPLIDQLNGRKTDFFKDYHAPTDQKVLAAMCRYMYQDLPAEMHPSIFTSKTFTKLKAKGDKDQFDLYAEKVFANTFLVDQAKLDAFLKAPSLKAIEADLGVQHAASIITLYREKMMAGRMVFDATNEEGMRLFQAAMMEMQTTRKFYPDANFTMRLSYGKVIPYEPRDGVSYKYMTWGEGVLEKEVPNDEEFHVPAKLKDLLVRKDFGPYGENGKLPLCFLSDNDITGGNSGSPVINGNGELVGIAFDGNWESMTGDLVFDSGVQRTISVDIRYVLFCIDKYAGASNLIKELTVVN